MLTKTHKDVMDELKAKKKLLEEQLKEESKLAFKEMSKELFADHPELRKFSWTQYTPYFNDGSECVFSAQTDWPTVYFQGDDQKIQAVVNKLDGMSDTDGMTELNDGTYWEGSTQKHYALTKVHYRQNKVYKAVQKFLQPFDEDDLKTMFDDHAEITVSRNKVKVEEYEHD